MLSPISPLIRTSCAAVNDENRSLSLNLVQHGEHALGVGVIPAAADDNLSVLAHGCLIPLLQFCLQIL